MSARPLILALAITAFAVTVAAIIYHRPYFRGTRILPAAGRPEVTKYAQEFADSLSISTHWNTGEPLPEPHVYLQGGDAISPDGRLTLRQRRLRNDYHEITLSSRPGTFAETILILQNGGSLLGNFSRLALVSRLQGCFHLRFRHACRTRPHEQPSSDLHRRAAHSVFDRSLPRVVQATQRQH